MPKVNIYLPDDLAEAVKDAGVPVSAVCQRALEQAVRRVTAIRAVAGGAWAPDPVGPPVVSFTKNAMAVLQSAQVAAHAAGLAEFHTEHLLTALLAGDNMAVRVLNALEITPHQVRAALASQEPAKAGAAGGLAAGEAAGARPGARATGGLAAGEAAGTGAAASGPAEGEAAGTGAGAAGGPVPEGYAMSAAPAGFGAEAAIAVELAATESSGLGNGYIGCEHLLLGLIGEPAGVAGRVLRSLGADLRVTRRTVAAALAGWGAGVAAHQERSGGSPAGGTPGSVTSGETSGEAARIGAIIRAELEPVLARIERLEQLATR